MLQPNFYLLPLHGRCGNITDTLKHSHTQFPELNLYTNFRTAKKRTNLGKVSTNCSNAEGKIWTDI